MGARLDFVPALDSLGDGKKMKREIYILCRGLLGVLPIVFF
jgi:hypothetical protein